MGCTKNPAPGANVRRWPCLFDDRQEYELFAPASYGQPAAVPRKRQRVNPLNLSPHATLEFACLRIPELDIPVTRINTRVSGTSKGLAVRRESHDDHHARKVSPC